jgi:hypothetical protein
VDEARLPAFGKAMVKVLQGLQIVSFYSGHERKLPE